MEEREYIAAERALGHEGKAGETPDDARLRAAWEERLAPLLADIAPVTPPADLFDRTMARLDAASSPEALAPTPSIAPPPPPAPEAPTQGAEVIEIAALRRRVGRWKSIAGAAMAAAAALALYIAVPQQIGGTEDGARYVAVVTADDDGRTGLIIQFDTGTGVATVIPAGATAPSGSSYEMWHLPEGATRPVSLGLLPQNAVAERSFAAGPGDLFAISQEPIGGSPNGQPTQPLYHGQVVRVD
ncbi:MAG: anti-sigma factor [Pseudomonadota bacterium]